MAECKKPPSNRDNLHPTSTLTGVLLLLTRLLAAALLLTRLLLAWVLLARALVLLARVLVLIAHSNSPYSALRRWG
jgi:hypothetical protein